MTKKLRTWLAVIISASILSGCASTPTQSVFELNLPEQITARQWPAPPEKAHLSYLGSLYGESNFKRHENKQNFGSKLFRIIVGLRTEPTDVRNTKRPVNVLPTAERIFIADQSEKAVLVIDKTNNRADWLPMANKKEVFKSPVGLAIHSNNLYVSDSELGRVFVFDTELKPLFEFGEGELYRPVGIAIAEDLQTIFVADTEKDHVLEYTLNGELIEVHGSSGTDIGTFNGPTFLHYHSPFLYVSDTLNARIQILNLQTRENTSIGERGIRIGNFTKPKGIATDSSGNIWAAESYFDFILTYGENQTLLMAQGGAGIAPGSFNLPSGLAIDKDDRLWVADMLNGRIEVFQIIKEEP